METIDINLENIDNIVEAALNNTLEYDTPQPEENGVIPIKESVSSLKDYINIYDDSRDGGAYFKKIFDYNVSAAIIGVGGIGSYLAFYLARLGMSLDLVDNDNVEFTNIGGQLYSHDDIDLPKVEAIRRFCNNYGNLKGNYIYSLNQLYQRNSYRSMTLLSRVKAICSCVDNMNTRKAIFEDWLDYGSLDSVFIDGRLALSEFQVYCVLKEDTNAIQRYKETLFDSSEAESVACNSKQTTFTAAMIGSVMTNLLINALMYTYTKSSETVVELPLPFFTYYDAISMTFKTEF